MYHFCFLIFFVSDYNTIDKSILKYLSYVALLSFLLGGVIDIIVSLFDIGKYVFHFFKRVFCPAKEVTIETNKFI